MQVPLEIAFHNIKSAQWAEDLIRARVAELEEIYGRLISCRIRVDQRAKNAAGTIPPVVRIELGIPGHKELSVTNPNISNANSNVPICAMRSMKPFALPSGGCATSRSNARTAPRSRTIIPRTGASAKWRN